MKILFLAPYPPHQAPSQRFRFEYFLPLLLEKNINYDFQSFLSERGWKHLYEQGAIAQKITAVVGGYIRRVLSLFRLYQYDFIFIHRELTPFGPPVFEWIIARVFRKKIIYDFDDAIWMSDPNGESTLWKALKWRSKVNAICRWSWKVSAGNEYLANHARTYCDQVVLFPTVVDTATYQTSTLVKTSAKKNPIIGWTGSHSTLYYLDAVVPTLQALEKERDFVFLVIANKDPKLPLKNFQFIPWRKDSEIEDLAQVDIGIMPLEDNDWSKGKCGFKLIQYLALGIPAIASPVGVNEEIIEEGTNGYLASSNQEWLEKLTLLLDDSQACKRLGNDGKKKIEEHYSVNANREKWWKLFDM